MLVYPASVAAGTVRAAAAAAVVAAAPVAPKGPYYGELFKKLQQILDVSAPLFPVRRNSVSGFDEERVVDIISILSFHLC